MAALVEEERLLTLYADVHYYFSEPVPRPVHHRFDKASYVYLYRDSAEHRGRLEIANYAGKPEQDAFTGYLDSARILQSHKHPTLCTIVVDGFQPQAKDTASSDEYHWRLPSTDPRDEGKYLFRLHTIDLYFWTAEDAHRFIETAQTILQHEQLSVSGPPAPVTHAEEMSPVVRQLENVAVTDPAYHNGQTRNSRTGSAPAATHDIKKDDPTAFTPLGYNPAAPPAPEVIKHREKTPPPPDDGTGTGLTAAAYHEDAHSHSHQTYGGVPPPPPSTGHFQPSQPYSGHASPSPFSQGHKPSSASSYVLTHSTPPSKPSASFGPPPHGSVGSISPSPHSSHSYAPTPPKNPNAHFLSQASAPAESPAAEILGNSYISGPPQPLQHLQPQYPDYLTARPQSQEPIGGYSDYKYEQQPQQHHHHHHRHQSHDDDYNIHSQVYRPMPEERKHHKPSKQSSSDRPGRLEQKAEKTESGVNRFLKRLEQKIG